MGRPAAAERSVGRVSTARSLHSAFERKSRQATTNQIAIAASQITTSRTTGPRDDENSGALFGEYMNHPPSAVLAKTRETAAAPTMRAAATAMLTLTFWA